MQDSISDSAPKINTIPDKPVGIIDEDKLLLIITQLKVQNANLTKQIAELEYKNYIQQLYLKYNLSINDIIDNNGNIILGNKCQQSK